MENIFKLGEKSEGYGLLFFLILMQNIWRNDIEN